MLLADVGKNGIVRSFMFELPWIFGMASLSCYFFGVFHTLANVKCIVASSSGKKKENEYYNNSNFIFLLFIE